MEIGAPFCIRGARVADGTGAPLQPLDVFVRDDRIVGVEPTAPRPRPDYVIVPADGLVLAPGFIDVHSHADASAFLDTPDTSKILQGVTTEVMGNCGLGCAPRSPDQARPLEQLWGSLGPYPVWGGTSFRDYWNAAAASGLVTNAAPLVGHNVLRLAVMGLAPRPAEPEDLAAMERLLDEALADGAFGLSSGLVYAPGQYSEPDELLRLAAHLGRRVYATHIRNEGSGVEAAVEEALSVSRATGVPVQLSHLKAAGLPYWGKVPGLLALADDARAAGLTVGHDVYPYTASSTMLRACLPPWAQADSDDAVLARLRDPEALRRIARDIVVGVPAWESMVQGTGYDRIVIASTRDHQYEGESLQAIAERLGLSGFDALVHVLTTEALTASMILFSMGDDDMEAALAHPSTMIGSDGLPAGGGGRPHPRLYGTFPRVLGRYVRDRAILSLPTAIHKMTGLPADMFHIPDRGYIKSGAVADLVLLNPDTVADRATFDHPTAPPVGIEQVYQAGVLVVNRGQYVGPPRGQMLTCRA